MSQWMTLEGELIDDIYEAIRIEKIKSLDSNGTIIAYIGCDGQNLGTRGTSFVQCVAIHRYDDCASGKGGRVFYIRHVERHYKSRQRRLLREAEVAINLAQKLEPLFTELDIPFEVHADVNSYAGKNNENKSHEVHDAIKGWIESMGWVCKTKPQAFVASIVCDRHTRGVRPKRERPFGKRKRGKE